MSVVLITGASTGIGNATARALAFAGHTVYASMRDPAGRGAVHAQALLDLGLDEHLDLRVVELDVQSQDSADAAARTVIDEAGDLDVVVNNAGHLALGYAEAFTAEEIAHLFDINVFGQQRINRAVLPHMRERGTGYLIYIGSTTVPIYPPFCAPYVASKAAGDALAITTSYEVSQLGIETTVVQPGGLTSGTEHFPNASTPADKTTSDAYASLDPLAASSAESTVALNPPDGIEASPDSVGREIARLLALPFGTRPLRQFVDFQATGMEAITDLQLKMTTELFAKMGTPGLLHVRTPAADQLA